MSLCRLQATTNGVRPPTRGLAPFCAPDLPTATTDPVQIPPTARTLLILPAHPAKGAKVGEAVLPGSQVEISLGPHTDGQLYGLTTTAIYRVNPKTYDVKAPVRIRCGFAVTPAASELSSPKPVLSEAPRRSSWRSCRSAWRR